MTDCQSNCGCNHHRAEAASAKSLYDATKELASLRDQIAEARDRLYPHICDDGHPLIGYRQTDCPICRPPDSGHCSEYPDCELPDPHAHPPPADKGVTTGELTADEAWDAIGCRCGHVHRWLRDGFCADCGQRDPAPGAESGRK